jgi:hypothetical protein
MSSNRKTTPVSVIAIDIGKNSFHVVGQDQHGAIVLRQKWSRGGLDLVHDARLLGDEAAALAIRQFLASATASSRRPWLASGYLRLQTSQACQRPTSTAQRPSLAERQIGRGRPSVACALTGRGGAYSSPRPTTRPISSRRPATGASGRFALAASTPEPLPAIGINYGPRRQKKRRPGRHSHCLRTYGRQRPRSRTADAITIRGMTPWPM